MNVKSGIALILTFPLRRGKELAGERFNEPLMDRMRAMKLHRCESVMLSLLR
jgi:hypothetical protein